MKNILILGAGIYQVPLINMASKLGLITHVVSPNGKYPGLAIADYCVHLDTRDYKGIYEYSVANDISAVVTTGTDVAMYSLAYVCEKLNLPGPSINCGLVTTNKVDMKRAFKESNIPTADFCVVDSLEQAHRQSLSMSYPQIVKAVDSSGSRGITKIDTLAEVERAYSAAYLAGNDGRVIIEEFLDGVEFGAQAVVINGKLVDVVIHGDVVTSPPVCIPVGHFVPVDLDDSLQILVNEVVEKTVTALDINNAIANFDIMLVNNTPYVIEVGSRMGATCIPENLTAFVGLNFYELLIKIALGEDVTYTKTAHKKSSFSHLLTVNKSGVVEDISIPTFHFPNYKIDMKLDFEIGDTVFNFENGTHRVGQVVVSGEKLDICRDIALFISSLPIFSVRENKV